MTDSPTPPPDSSLRLLPLGGLGEVGMNCLALEQADGIVVVDCGTTFPDDDYGVDVVRPNFSWLEENADRLSGVFITHGHEDHIGALPHLLANLDAPVWGPPHALALAQRRLKEHGFTPREPWHTAVPGQRYQVGPFEIEPVRMAHSICEASSLSIQTSAGRVIHSGDFNFDPAPSDGEPTDEARLRELGDDGVELLLSDSTNVDRPGLGGSESEVEVALAEVVEEAQGRVFVALFASNVQRLISLGRIAQRTDRKICLLGRSLSSQVEITSQLGRLDWPSDLVIGSDRVDAYPADRLLFLVGGTQAEPNSALRRLSLGTHPRMTLDTSDTVVLSSRVIPGCEVGVHRMLCDLRRRRVSVHTEKSTPGIHTSGHATRGEQLKLIELLRPQSFVPLHGTLHHLERHAELARDAGVEDVQVMENGLALLLDDRGLWRDGPFDAGRVAVARGGQPISPGTLDRRMELGRYGLALVSLSVDADLRLVGRVHVTLRGVPGADDDERAKRQVADAVEEQLERLERQASRRVDVEHELRHAARRKLKQLSGTRPVVEIHLIRS